MSSLTAKLEQLGAFQFFFTLSCADKRWKEIYMSIFRQLGKEVSFKSGTQTNTIEDVLINGEPLEEYIAKENQHNLVQNHVLAVTRIFDHRVKAFFNNIVMGKHSPMKVQFYNYRVEFQLRGAGHIHGVLWCDLPELENEFPGLSDTITKLRSMDRGQLTEDEKSVLVDFVDEFTSCSLDDPDIANIVKEVQIHHHTNACRKYNTQCRFNYPKFPSDRTVIAQPLNLENDATDEERLYMDCNTQLKEYKQHVKHLKETLKKVKCVREDLHQETLESLKINDILQIANVTEEDYYKALSVSSNGTNIVLKRKVKEIYVNNYNSEWIKSWDGNMDIAVCLDFFSIITYITDYCSKDDTDTMRFLKAAARVQE